MKKRKFAASVLFLFAFAICLSAVTPDDDEIVNAAKTFFAAAQLPDSALRNESVDITPEMRPHVVSVATMKRDGVKLLHLVNFDQPRLGWVLMSASTLTQPVFAYGLDRNLSSFEEFTADSFLIDAYAHEVACAIKRPDDGTIDVDKYNFTVWDKLANFQYIPLFPLDTVVDHSCYQLGEILLQKGGYKNIWGQTGDNSGSGDCNYSYNKHCPGRGGCDCDKGSVGCTAVAVGQVMWYWEYPEKAVVNGEVHVYDWKNIPHAIYNSSYQKTPMNQVDNLAWYLRDVGCGIGVAYHPALFGCQSSCPLFAVVSPLQNVFGYSNRMEYKTLINYSNEDRTRRFKNDIMMDILMCRPVLYQAWDETNPFGCHTLVIDGYDKMGYFHANLGHKGGDNAWYDLTNISHYNRTIAIIRKIWPFNTNQNSPVLADEDAKDDSLSKVKIDYFPSARMIVLDGVNEVVDISVYTIDGRKIISSNVTELNVSELSSGLYLVVVSANNVSITSKLLSL